MLSGWRESNTRQDNMKKRKGKQWGWDLLCLLSGIGIWPRYIEPRLLSITRLQIAIPSLPSELRGLKLVQFSDLHWHACFSKSFENRLIARINALEPDLLLFTGDFICRSHLERAEDLARLLCTLRTRYGAFAIWGNHDYAQFVTLNARGEYEVSSSSSTPLWGGIQRLLNRPPARRQVSSRAEQVVRHEPLFSLLSTTPFHLLDNESTIVKVRGCYLNLCGLGEYTLGKCLPHMAFSRYDDRYPGIILSHNPDSIPLLLPYPGHLILSGHTHGGEVNLPFIRHRLTPLEQPQFMRGLHRLADDKYAYINRGIGGVLPFRWCASPELSLITLERK